MKKFLLIGIVFSLISCGETQVVNEKKAYKEITPEKIEYRESIEIHTKVKANKVTSIKPKYLSRIKKIYVSLGDEVKRGDKLLELSSYESNAEYSAQSTQINNLNESLSNKRQMLTDELRGLDKKISIAEENLNSLQKKTGSIKTTASSNNQSIRNEIKTITNKIDSLKKTSVSSVDTLEKQIENSNQKMENAIKTLEISKKSNDISADSMYTEAVIFANSLINSIYAINNQSIGDQNFDVNFSTSDTSAKRTVEDNVRRLFIEKNEIEEKYNNADKENVYENLLELKKWIDDAKVNLLQSMNNVLQNTPYSINNEAFSNQITTLGSSATSITKNIDDLNINKENIKTQISNLKLETESSVAVLKSQINDIYANTESAIKELEDNRDTLKSQLVTTSSMGSVSTGDINSAIKIAMQQLEAAKTEKKVVKSRLEYEILQLENSIKSTESQKDVVGSVIAESIIEAPYDGVISKKNFFEGEMVSNMNEVLEIMDDSEKKLEVFVPGSFVNNIKVGQRIYINDYNAGVVTKIAPAIDETTSKIKIEILIDKERDVKVGEDVKVNIYSNNASEKMLIPMEAIKEISGYNFVRTHSGLKRININAINNSGAVIDIDFEDNILIENE